MQSLKNTFVFSLVTLVLLFGFISPSVAATSEEKEMADAILTIKTLADQGDAKAQYILGSLYQKFEEHHTAFEWFEKSALQGNEASQSKVGFLYYTGLGVRQDYAKAFEFSLKAANKKVEASYFPVAVMYELGQGVRQDNKKAKDWYGKYCDSGNQLGCDEYRKLNKQGY
jgi:hypothetical protein